MPYALEITPACRRQLKKLSASVQKSIRDHLNTLCLSPFKSNLDIKKLSGREGYRLGLGDYRVIYMLDNRQCIVIALEAGHRREIY